MRAIEITNEQNDILLAYSEMLEVTRSLAVDHMFYNLSNHLKAKRVTIKPITRGKY